MHDGIGEDVIFSYSRAQAIEDGVLVDLSKYGAEAGIKYPVAITSAAYEKCIVVPTGCEGLQDVSGRAWDVVWMMLCTMRRVAGSSLTFQVSVVTGRGPRGAVKSKLVTLKALCGPGDSADPVITVMFPEED